MPTTLTTLSTQISSLSSGPPPIREPEDHFVTHDAALQTAREFLLSYWQGQPWHSAADPLFLSNVWYSDSKERHASMRCVLHA